eukprot:COSAG04_NODE_32299_length_252_cov_0.522876_1_plen_54_part_10
MGRGRRRCGSRTPQLVGSARFMRLAFAQVKTLMDTLLLALRLDPKTVEEGEPAA